MLNSNVDEYKRGDIVWVDFGETDEGEQGGIRPAVIIQNNVGNKYSPCVIVAPITSKSKKPMGTHVGIKPDDTVGLTKPSIILTEQINTVNKKKIIKKAGQISENMVKCINRAICFSLALA